MNVEVVALIVVLLVGVVITYTFFIKRKPKEKEPESSEEESAPPVVVTAPSLPPTSNVSEIVRRVETQPATPTVDPDTEYRKTQLSLNKQMYDRFKKSCPHEISCKKCLASPFLVSERYLNGEEKGCKDADPRPYGFPCIPLNPNTTKILENECKPLIKKYVDFRNSVSAEVDRLYPAGIENIENRRRFLNSRSDETIRNHNAATDCIEKAYRETWGSHVVSAYASGEKGTFPNNPVLCNEIRHQK